MKGDSLSASIAAASILAKVYRDDIMLEMAERYPQYGFEVHKGYGTKRHYAALEEFGPCPIHRQSFLKSFMPGSNLTGPWGRRWRRRICGKKRYTLVACNYRCRFGEVDLIVQDRKYVVFVEVKLRKSARFASAMEYGTVASKSV